jgi:hypothetical protein
MILGSDFYLQPVVAAVGHNDVVCGIEDDPPAAFQLSRAAAFAA